VRASRARRAPRAVSAAARTRAGRRAGRPRLFEPIGEGRAAIVEDRRRGGPSRRSTRSTRRPRPPPAGRVPAAGRLAASSLAGLGDRAGVGERGGEPVRLPPRRGRPAGGRWFVAGTFRRAAEHLADPPAQPRVAVEAEGDREPGHRRLADLGPLGEFAAGQVRGLGGRARPGTARCVAGRASAAARRTAPAPLREPHTTRSSYAYFHSPAAVVVNSSWWSSRPGRRGRSRAVSGAGRGSAGARRPP
jgi:hypothetical protein